MKKLVKAKSTGKPLDLDDQEHCSVVLSTDTLKMKIAGKFRQRERKLYVLLVHSVWDELGTKRKYTVEIEKIKQVMTEIGKTKEFNTWLWDYLKNLARIEIEYQCDSLRGITRLFSEVTFDENKEHVTFEIPQTVEQAILNPNGFTRLDTYFLIGLKGKYSVSLYQLLESKINLRKFDPKHTPDPNERFIEIPLNELRNWLGIGDNEYPLWNNFNARVLKPAVEEINSNPIATTFTVKTKDIRGKRNKVMAIRFFLTKTAERIEKERSIQTSQQAKRNAERHSFIIPPFRGTEIYDKAKNLAPNLDVYVLEAEWREYSKNQNIEIDSPEGAFLGFVKKRAKGNPSNHAQSKQYEHERVEKANQDTGNSFLSIFRNMVK